MLDFQRRIFVAARLQCPGVFRSIRQSSNGESMTQNFFSSLNHVSENEPTYFVGSPWLQKVSCMSDDDLLQEHLPQGSHFVHILMFPNFLRCHYQRK